jgi:hypothetical protein
VSRRSRWFVPHPADAGWARFVSLAEVVSCPQKDDSKALAAWVHPDPPQTAKVTPQEVEAFCGWLVATRQAAVEAAKEGGFIGFGAEQMSAGKQPMLDQLRAGKQPMLDQLRAALGGT